VKHKQSFLSITARPTFLLEANKPSVFLNGKSVWLKKLTSSALAWTFLKTHSKEMLKSNCNIEFPFIRQL